MPSAVECIAAVAAEIGFPGAFNGGQDFGFGRLGLDVEAQCPRRSERKHFLPVGSREIILAVEQVGIDAGFDFVRLPRVVLALARLAQDGKDTGSDAQVFIVLAGRGDVITAAGQVAAGIFGNAPPGRIEEFGCRILIRFNPIQEMREPRRHRAQE